MTTSEQFLAGLAESHVRAAAVAIAKTYSASTPFSRWSEHAQGMFMTQARAALEAIGMRS